MKIVVGADEASPLLDALVLHLEGRGHEVDVSGVLGDPWPDVGRSVGERVAAGQADVGIVCCWTGTGVSIAANKVPGVRAALCADAETAAGARRWNDANVIALSLRATTAAIGIEVVDAFLATAPDEDERRNFGRLT